MRNSGKAAIINAVPSGVSGDKFLGALLDLGGSTEALERVASVLEKNLPGTSRVEVKTSKVERGEIGARLVSVHSEERVRSRKGPVLQASILKCAKTLGMSEWATAFSESVIDTLLAAESRVHGRSSQSLELHELGSADTLVDILGVAYLADDLGLSRTMWWSTPVAVGSGVTHFSGRDYPNPAPAVAEILRAHKFPMETHGTQHELTTPTGAAIAVNLAGKGTSTPPMLRPDKIGYGAGAADFEEMANVLRITIGELAEVDHIHDEVVVLETNLDDVSGEVIGRAMEKLIIEGARDVSIAPIFMKKNRPGYLVSVISDKSKSERLAELLMEETGSLGIREIPVSRHISRRANSTVSLEVAGRNYPVRVKGALTATGHQKGGKVEYEDLRRISNETGLSVRELQKRSSLLLSTRGK